MLSADFIRHPPCLNLFATALVSSCHFPIKECVYWLHCLALNSRLKIVNKLFSHVLMHAIIMTLEFVCQTKSQSLLATLPCLKLQALQSDQPIQKKYGIAMSPPSKLLINCVCLLTFAIFHSKYRHLILSCVEYYLSAILNEFL